MGHDRPVTTQPGRPSTSPGATDGRWEFWVDRGGTFTDVVARGADGELHVAKVLSEARGRRTDSVIAGIRGVLGVGQGAHRCPSTGSRRSGSVRRSRRTRCSSAPASAPLSPSPGASGTHCASATRTDPGSSRATSSSRSCSTRASSRWTSGSTADGEVLVPLDEAAFADDLQRVHDVGIRSIAVVLVHGYRHPDHEQAVASIAREIGFSQVSVSHQVSPLIKLVARGDTTVVDAYLSPLLDRYVGQLAEELPGGRPALHAVQRRPDRRPPLPGSRTRSVRTGRRGRRHGPELGAGGVPPGRGLRHGWHVDRCLALRRRARAGPGDGGRRRPDARSDDEHPHRRRRRGIGPALRRHAVPGRARLGGRRPRSCLLPPGRPARSHRRERPARADPARPLPAGVRPGGRPAHLASTWSARRSPRSPRRSGTATGHAPTPEKVAAGFRQVAVANMANAISGSRSSAATTSASTPWPRSVAPAASTRARWRTRWASGRSWSTGSPACCRPTASARRTPWRCRAVRRGAAHQGGASVLDGVCRRARRRRPRASCTRRACRRIGSARPPRSC